MDVNGTRYHLLYGRDDWGQCLLEANEHNLTDLWSSKEESQLSVPLEWDDESASLRLTRELPLVRLVKPAESLSPERRRGAARDKYGNWYWIDASQNGLRFLPADAYVSQPYWTTIEPESDCTTGGAGSFIPCKPPVPQPLKLRGLAVTTRHYLVVGVVGEQTSSGLDTSKKGLLIFDLYTGGAPLHLYWPGNRFDPWDFAANDDGSLLILDREHSVYWLLDTNFRLLMDVTKAPTDFQPVKTASERVCNVTTTVFPGGYQLPQKATPSLLSIEPGPNNHVLILESNPDENSSTIYEYEQEKLIASYSLQKKAQVLDLAGDLINYPIIGYDFAYNKASNVLYVADRGGMQVFAFDLDSARLELNFQRSFLPLRLWSGKALVYVDQDVYYDLADRWVALGEFTECHYATSATLMTPAHYRFFDTTAGRPFDSNIPGCTWHRLFLDAQIPQGTDLSIQARATDDADLLEQVRWSEQPVPYLRSDGAELPYYDPWLDTQPLPERTGTWELLFQGISGRYLQLRITIRGNGRATPALRALRAWYPRFSYLEHYLPAIYSEDPLSASFLERWLANFEGLYTNLEDKIEHIALLFDPRTIPPDALVWLACWFGLVLDPLWTVERKRLLIRHIDQLYRMRGTVQGLEIAMHLYLDRQVDESIFTTPQSATSTVRIVENFLLQRTQAASTTVKQDYTHRFTVLIHHDLSEEQLQMVERIVELEKPAHTGFEIKCFWETFQVGEARLGLNTRLNAVNQFTPLLLGNTHLEHVYLYAPYPFDIADRPVLDRDRLGGLPAL